MFQQVTEVFGLEHLIGTKPEGVIFQFAMCLLLYNLIQVVRGVIAVEVQRQREEISGEKLFEDVQRQMIAWSATVEPEETIAHFEGEWTAMRVKVRLSELLRGLWKDRWLKSPPKKPGRRGRWCGSGRIVRCTGSWRRISNDSRKKNGGSASLKMFTAVVS